MTLPSGHNFGCHHNPEVATNTVFSHGHGHHIEAGSASTGYRTILAYWANGHSTRVNHYSNPSVLYPPTNTPTGLHPVSNNAAVLRLNRFSMADIGDESGVCRDYVRIESEIYQILVRYDDAIKSVPEIKSLS